MRHYLSSLFILFGLALSSFPTALYSQSDYTKAWQALDQGKVHRAVSYLETASKGGEKQSEALLALSLIYPINGRTEEGQQAFRQYVDLVENPYPAVYAMWEKSSALGPNGKHDKIHLSLLEQLLERPDLQQHQYGAMLYRHYFHYIMSYDTDNARKVLAKMNYIRKWSFLGPFDNVMNSGFDKDFGVLDHPEATARFISKYGGEVSWFQPERPVENGYFILPFHFLARNALTYAQTFVYAEEAQKVIVKFSYSLSETLA